MSQYDLCREILAERLRQENECGFGPAWDDARTPAEWVAILCRQAGLALDDGGTINGDDGQRRYRRQLVRTAAVALAALESYERVYDRPAGPAPEQRGKGY
jgi:hypothetical protein